MNAKEIIFMFVITAINKYIYRVICERTLTDYSRSLANSVAECSLEGCADRIIIWKNLNAY